MSYHGSPISYEYIRVETSRTQEKRKPGEVRETRDDNRSWENGVYQGRKERLSSPSRVWVGPETSDSEVEDFFDLETPERYLQRPPQEGKGFYPFRSDDHISKIIEEDHPPIRQLNHEYKRLGKDEIRLIKLYPSPDPDADLLCSLFHVDLTQPYGPYEAVSYAWGTKEDPEKLYVIPENEALYELHRGVAPTRYGDSEYIAITANLDSALRRFRRSNAIRLLWADAVCLDQESTEEKFYQIPNIQEIYTKASNVLIWLGGAGEEGRICLEFFDRLSKKTVRQQVELLSPQNLARMIDDSLDETFQHRRLDALERFFHPVNRPWFLRRWVIQEVGASRDALVYCGPHDPIRWSKFALAVEILNQHPNRIYKPALSTISAIYRLREMSAIPVLDLLTEFHESDCSEAKDRITAIAGLSNLPKLNRSFFKQFIKDKKEVTEMPTYEFYFHIAKTILERFNDHLELLHCGAAFQPPNDDARRAKFSWVPEWRVPPLFNSLLNIPKFHAGFDTKTMRQMVSIHVRPKSNVPFLRVVGFEFSEVFERTNPGGFKIPEPEKIHTQIPFWLPKEEWYRDGHPDTYRTRRRYESYWMAFARTIVADYGPSLSMKSRLEGSSAEMEEQAKEIGEGFKDISRFTEEMRMFVRKEDRPRPAKSLSLEGKITYTHQARRYARLVTKAMGGPGGTSGRCFFLCEEPRYMGIGPDTMRRKDRIVIFYGARTPFIIRPIKGTSYFRLVGDCYINGIMNGETLDMGHKEKEYLII